MATIISALISAASAIAVCVVSQGRTMSLIEYKLTELTKRVEKHNSLVERTYELEKAVALINEELK